MQAFDKTQEEEMSRAAADTLQNLPENVSIKCWTTSLIVLEINKFSVLRLLIEDRIGKEPRLKIEKDVQFLDAEGIALRNIIDKQRKKYSSVILPLYSSMKEQRNVFKNK
jgi:hypothetical protein